MKIAMTKEILLELLESEAKATNTIFKATGSRVFGVLERKIKDKKSRVVLFETLKKAVSAND